MIELAIGLPGDVTIIPDHGGVGVAWTAELREYAQQSQFCGRIIPIASVGNNANALTHTDRSGHLRLTVPKIELVTALNLIRQTRIINPCPQCQPSSIHNWRVKDLAKVWCEKSDRYGDTGTVRYIDSAAVGVEFPDGDQLEYDAAELVLASGPPPTDFCRKCSKLRFTKTVDRDEFRHLTEELKSFQLVQRQGSRAVNSHFEQGGSIGGAKHHGDLAMALALGLWYSGRGNRQLVMHVGGK